MKWQKRDRYQRILGKVLVDGQDVNLEQIKAGLAWHYKQYGKSSSLLISVSMGKLKSLPGSTEWDYEAICTGKSLGRPYG